MLQRSPGSLQSCRSRSCQHSCQHYSTAPCACAVFHAGLCSPPGKWGTEPIKLTTLTLISASRPCASCNQSPSVKLFGFYHFSAWQEFGGAQVLTLLGKGAGCGFRNWGTDFDTDAKTMLQFPLPVWKACRMIFFVYLFNISQGCGNNFSVLQLLCSEMQPQTWSWNM